MFYSIFRFAYCIFSLTYCVFRFAYCILVSLIVSLGLLIVF